MHIKTWRKSRILTILGSKLRVKLNLWNITIFQLLNLILTLCENTRGLFYWCDLILITACKITYPVKCAMKLLPFPNFNCCKCYCRFTAINVYKDTMSLCKKNPYIIYVYIKGNSVSFIATRPLMSIVLFFLYRTQNTRANNRNIDSRRGLNIQTPSFPLWI